MPGKARTRTPRRHVHLRGHACILRSLYSHVGVRNAGKIGQRISCLTFTHPRTTFGFTDMFFQSAARQAGSKGTPATDVMHSCTLQEFSRDRKRIRRAPPAPLPLCSCAHHQWWSPRLSWANRSKLTRSRPNRHYRIGSFLASLRGGTWTFSVAAVICLVRAVCERVRSMVNDIKHVLPITTCKDLARLTPGNSTQSQGSDALKDSGRPATLMHSFVTRTLEATTMCIVMCAFHVFNVATRSQGC